MDKDRVKGKMDEIAGRAKKKAGEWTGDTQTQGEGAAKEIKGKVQNAWGKVKDEARDAKRDIKRDLDRQDRNVETDRKRDVA